MAFGNGSQEQSFKQSQGQGRSLDQKTAQQLDPQFQTINQQGFGDQAPTLAELKAAPDRQIKGAPDKYHHFALKEALKLRSVVMIVAIWLLVHLLVAVFANHDPSHWYVMTFNPMQQPGLVHDLSLQGGALATVAGLLQIILGALIAPFVFSSWLNFVLNLAFLLLLAWSAKFVQVDDARIVRSYLLIAIFSSFVVYGLVRLVMYAMTLTKVSANTWVELLQNTNGGVFGLQFGLIGLWIFVVLQTLFERAKAPAYAHSQDVVKARRISTAAAGATFGGGLLYLIWVLRPSYYGDVHLGYFAIGVCLVSLVIGVIRGVSSYYTMAQVRQHGRL